MYLKMEEEIAMMQDKIYQQIYNEVDSFLPNKWNKLVVYIEYGADSYSMSFYVTAEGKTVKCFDLPYIDESKLLDAFSRIDKIVGPERDNEADKWSNMTLVIEDESFKADFDYTDLSKGSFAYKREWKKKYL